MSNTGKVDGEEVVQLYITHGNSNLKEPIRAMISFKRIFLKAGESHIVTFQLRPQDLSIIDKDGTARHVPGTVLLVGVFSEERVRK